MEQVLTPGLGAAPDNESHHMRVGMIAGVSQRYQAACTARFAGTTLIVSYSPIAL